tara:strand:+ start:178 stop:906 length:729 start_codon:yes stop_codon:yes gene_type:complete
MYQEKIVVILPVLNEEGKIGNTVKKVLGDVPEGVVNTVLVVNDGSTDGTEKEAEEAGAKVITHVKNAGVGAAIRTGIKYAQKENYDIVVVMAGDDQDLPSEMCSVLEPIIKNEADFVQGSRRLNELKVVNISLFRRVTTKLFSWIFSVFTGYPCTDGTNGYRAFTVRFTMDKKMNLEQPWLNRYELEPYLLYHAAQLSEYRLKEVQVTKVYHEGKSYSKMIPIISWWSILRPLIFLRIGIKH